MFFQMLLMSLLCSGADSCFQHLAITTPSPMQALSGTCLFIPCTYETLSSSQHINTANPVTGIWCKQEKMCPNSQFSVSGNPSKSYPMNVTGNVKNRDCTTMFYNLSQIYQDNYYFRVENDPFKATALCDPLQITVRDSPWIPSIKVSGDQTETEEVTITCSAVTPCPLAPPELTWDLRQGTAKVTETNSDRTVTTKITQNITLTDSHDALMIKCNAKYPVSGGLKMSDSNVTLSVSYGPKDTSAVVSPSGSLSAGQSVTLSCSSRAKPPVHCFTWFRRSSQGAENVSEGQTYSFNICEGGEYYCVASNKHGNGSSSDIKLQITDAPAIPSIKVSGEQTETEVVTITCSAVTPCPRAPELTWDLHQGTANVTETNGTPTTKITHTINLTDSHDGKIIKCSAAYPVSGGFKTTESTVTLNVTYGPKDTSAVVSPSGSLSAGQSVTLSCSSRAKPPVHCFTWFRRSSQGAENVSEGQIYSFNFTEKGNYFCVASNALGNRSSPVITLNSLTGTSNRGGVQWGVILGAVIGVIMVICLGLFVWCFKVKCQSPKVTQQREMFVHEVEETIHYGEIDFTELKSKDAINSNPDDEPKEETVYSKVKVSQAEVTVEETIHYGELDFSKLRPKAVSNNTEQEDTVYSQVQVSKPADAMGQVKDGVESLYASVTKN